MSRIGLHLWSLPTARPCMVSSCTQCCPVHGTAVPQLLAAALPRIGAVPACWGALPPALHCGASAGTQVAHRLELQKVRLQ